MTPQLLAAASKLAASAACHQRALSASRDGSFISQIVRFTALTNPVSSSAQVGARSARSGRSTLLLVLRILPGMQRACRAVEKM
jgi:hypothetical protein